MKRMLTSSIGHEAHLQLRSLRFATSAVVFLAAACLPAAVAFARWPTSPFVLGPATFAAETFAVLPLLLGIFGFAIGVDAIQREIDEGSWSVLSLNPQSNSGYILRRWIALWVLMIPLAITPLAVAALLAWLRNGTLSLGVFLWPWLLQVLPMLVVGSALGLSFGVLGRGILGGALLAGVVFGVSNAALERFSGRFHLSLDSVEGFLNLSQVRWTVLGIWGWLRGQGIGAAIYPVPVSETPFDPRVASEQYLSHEVIAIGSAGLLLALAAQFLGRTRRDLRPWHVSEDHALRNLLGYVNRVRQRYSRDGGLGRKDYALLALGVVVFSGSLAAQAGRGAHYFQVAEREWRAAGTTEPAMSTSVVPVHYAVVGAIGESGEVRSRVVVDVENRGEAPETSLVFTVDLDLRLSDLTTDRGAVRSTRAYQRLVLDVEPPLPPGDRRTFTIDFEGAPARAALGVPGWIGADRGIYDKGSLRATFRPDPGSRSAASLDRSFMVPSFSKRRLALAARDVLPVPYYGQFSERPLPEDVDLTGGARPPDQYQPGADLEIELEVPSGVLVADACGGLVKATDADRRLRSRCSLPPAQYAVVGGEYEVVSDEAEGPVIVALAHHVEIARQHLSAISREASFANRLWPSLPSLSSRIVVEWPDFAVHRLGSYVDQAFWGDLLDSQGDGEAPAIAQGRLLLVSETRLARRKPIEIAPVLSGTVATELLARRPVAPDQETLFRTLYEELVRLRMGAAPRSGAVVPAFQGGPGPVLVPLLEVQPGNRPYWTLRFPALVFALQNRVGTTAIMEGVDRFTGEAGTGTLDELLTDLEEASGESLDRFTEDFIRIGALPQVHLSDIRLSTVGARWRIDGSVVNVGGGEAVCTVEAVTAVGVVSARVSATPDRPGRFTLETRYRPQALLLDPEELCHRYRTLLSSPVERVDFGGAG